MLKPRILVTGATGKTGSVVVAELLKLGYPVRAMVHREDDRSARLAGQGAEIAVADMSDVERVADALRDVQRAYYCPPFDPYMLQGAVAFLVAARESRLEHIVGLTQWLSSPSHPALMTRQHWLVDRLFSMAPGVTHTIIRPGFFADGYLMLTGVAAQLGVFPWIYGDSRTAPPSNEDIARLAVCALMDPARHAGRSYRPTGPELLGAQDIAKAIGRAVGRSVRAVPAPTWLFMKSARRAGLPVDVMSGIRYYIDDHRRGAFELAAPTTDVLEVTGRPAESFETIARRYAALPGNRRTRGNWLRELVRFIAAPLSPAFNLALRPRATPPVPVGAAVRNRVRGLASRARHPRIGAPVDRGTARGAPSALNAAQSPKSLPSDGRQGRKTGERGRPVQSHASSAILASTFPFRHMMTRSPISWALSCR